MKRIDEVLKRGKVENEAEAQLFAENADFELAEECGKGCGDFCLKTETGFAEIYGEMKETGEDEETPVPSYPQNIRFFNEDMEPVD